ncbi:uncharacterized protein [Procambarus clarkii]|uniref:uncharacterized protein isoform X4 n=1 Tax=Procambarus clarkii TaxID=6728 RepID=UPI003744809E
MFVLQLPARGSYLKEGKCGLHPGYTCCTNKIRNLFNMMESRFCKIAAIMTNKIDCPEDGRVLYSSRACAHSDFGRRGILMKLGEMLVTIASNQGFQMITTVVTNPFAEKVLLRLGCKVQTTFDFHTLEEGLLDVSRMDQKQFKIMTKYLSPTTPKSQL